MITPLIINRTRRYPFSAALCFEVVMDAAVPGAGVITRFYMNARSGLSGRVVEIVGSAVNNLDVLL
jgi:hypothetical protein